MASPDNRLYKVENLLRLLNKCKLSMVGESGKKVTIEALRVPFRGRIKFCQYSPNNRCKYGLKIYIMCLLGYTWHPNVFTGKQPRPSDNLTVTTKTIKYLVGTLSINRKQNPHRVTKAKIKRGDMKSLPHNNQKMSIRK